MQTAISVPSILLGISTKFGISSLPIPYFAPIFSSVITALIFPSAYSLIFSVISAFNFAAASDSLSKSNLATSAWSKSYSKRFAAVRIVLDVTLLYLKQPVSEHIAVYKSLAISLSNSMPIFSNKAYKISPAAAALPST